MLNLTNNIEKYRSGYIRIRKELEVYPEITFNVEEMGGGVLVSFKQAGGVNEGINEGVNEGVKLLLGLIMAHPGINGPELSQRLKIPPKTLERWLKQLKDQNKIEHRGSRKTGGYHITDVKVDP